MVLAGKEVKGQIRQIVFIALRSNGGKGVIEAPNHRKEGSHLKKSVRKLIKHTIIFQIIFLVALQ